MRVAKHQDVGLWSSVAIVLWGAVGCGGSIGVDDLQPPGSEEEDFAPGASANAVENEGPCENPRRLSVYNAYSPHYLWHPDKVGDGMRHTIFSSLSFLDHQMMLPAEQENAFITVELEYPGDDTPPLVTEVRLAPYLAPSVRGGVHDRPLGFPRVYALIGSSADQQVQWATGWIGDQPPKLSATVRESNVSLFPGRVMSRLGMFPLILGDDWYQTNNALDRYSLMLAEIEVYGVPGSCALD